VVIVAHHVFKKERIKRTKKANKINNLYAEPPDAPTERNFFFEKKCVTFLLRKFKEVKMTNEQFQLLLSSIS